MLLVHLLQLLGDVVDLHVHHQVGHDDPATIFVYLPVDNHPYDAIVHAAYLRVELEGDDGDPTYKLPTVSANPASLVVKMPWHVVSPDRDLVVELEVGISGV